MDNARTSEWIHRDQHTTDIRVDLAVGPPLLQVLVDALVRDRGQ